MKPEKRFALNDVRCSILIYSPLFLAHDAKITTSLILYSKNLDAARASHLLSLIDSILTPDQYFITGPIMNIFYLIQCLVEMRILRLNWSKSVEYILSFPDRQID